MKSTHARAEAAASDAADGYSAVSWDPYEVWRTRVLLPRQQQQAAAQAPDPPPQAEQSRQKLASRAAMSAVAVSIAVVLIITVFGSER